jgi:hypothetical protein
MAVAAACIGGCVERRYVITSDPPSAVVVRNYEQPLGWSPVDDHFTYYGMYHFTLTADGYQTLQVDQVIRPPWFEYFPLEFIAENLIPWRIEDVRYFHYRLEPLQTPNVDELRQQGEVLRNRGRSIVPTAPP